MVFVLFFILHGRRRRIEQALSKTKIHKILSKNIIFPILNFFLLQPGEEGVDTTSFERGMMRPNFKNF